MTHGWFTDQIQKVDVLAEVDFESIPYGIRIRPSHPRYFDAICEVANNERRIGCAVSVMREVDFFLTYSVHPLFAEPCAPPALTIRKRLALIFRGKWRAGLGL